MNKTEKVKAFTILTPKTEYVPLELIKEPVGLNGGDTEETRWDLDVPEVRKAFEKLVDSIRKNGFLIGVVAIKLPHDVVLFDKTYTKKVFG